MQQYTSETEGKNWQDIQEIRGSFTPKLLEDIRATSKEDAIERATDVIQRTLTSFRDNGYSFANVEPGHGIGHLVRDYMNSYILFSGLEADPKHLFLGFVGGSLHDLGCAVVPRYDESKRAVRHAEAGSLLVKSLLENETELNDAEKTSIAYVIAAHTHYRGEDPVKCQDGETRIVKPYQELDETGHPIWPVWFTRWVDRLDCNGPAFVGRHYLTLGEKHEDYDGVVHFDVDFSHHMKPLLRPFKEQVDESGKRNQTMSEHMKMFADSQNNESPYGKHDYGFMVKLRDRSRERLYRIVNSTQLPPQFSVERESEIRRAWASFLSENVEPSRLGRQTALTLDGMFSGLEEGTRHAWCNGFLSIMQEYIPYSLDRLKLLEKETLNDAYFHLPGIAGDIRGVISAKGKAWVAAV
ncbi:hypothetical protein J4422_01745 [Candidatus Pacearchaeota archaeon]|nr:hypothetical protein [Candidatus Pacearchaeota archaeon]